MAGLSGFEAWAALLAKAETQLNVVIGLCVGHDSLFFMHSKAPATVLVAKDRVLTLGGSGRLTQWSLPKCTPVYTLKRFDQPVDPFDRGSQHQESWWMLLYQRQLRHRINVG